VRLYVIDASVAAKWFLPAAGEPLSEEAAGWLRRTQTGHLAWNVVGILIGMLLVLVSLGVWS